MAGSCPDGCWQHVSLPGVVVSDEAKCQLLPKVFDDDLAAAVGFGAVVLADCEGIHDAGVHQEPKNVAVAFPGLGTHPVVTTGVDCSCPHPP